MPFPTSSTKTDTKKTRVKKRPRNTKQMAASVVAASAPVPAEPWQSALQVLEAYSQAGLNVWYSRDRWCANTNRVMSSKLQGMPR